MLVELNSKCLKEYCNQIVFINFSDLFQLTYFVLFIFLSLSLRKSISCQAKNQRDFNVKIAGSSAKFNFLGMSHRGIGTLKAVYFADSNISRLYSKKRDGFIKCGNMIFCMTLLSGTMRMISSQFGIMSHPPHNNFFFNFAVQRCSNESVMSSRAVSSNHI